jgi:hypothetical protein
VADLSAFEKPGTPYKELLPYRIKAAEV